MLRSRLLSWLLLVLVPIVLPGTASAEPPDVRAATTCSDYENQADAQRAADTRDADGDGIYCESLPCPCLRPGGGGRGESEPRRRPKPRSRAQVFHARVTPVVDGDTLKVRTTRGRRRSYTVRLIGIDTPESRKPGTPVECGAREATASMERMALDGRGRGRRVRLTTDPSQDTFDRYRRLLAYVETTTGRQLNVGQVAAGWAQTYVYRGKPFRQVSRFQSAERRARSADRGVWGECGGDFHGAAERARAARSNYCSPSGDYCTEVEGRGRRVVLAIASFAFSGRYRLCVTKVGRRGDCRTFRLRRRGGLYESRVRWSTRFPDRGRGRYRASWYLGDTRLGPSLSFRR